MTSLSARITGVIRAPRSTLAAVAAPPRWADVLLLTTLVGFLASAILLSTETGRLALVDQWERTAIAFGGTVDDAQYAQFQDLSSQGIAYAAVTALTSGPVLVFALTAVLLGASRTVLRSSASFSQILSIVSHAGVILALRQVIAAPLSYANETLASPTTLVRFAGVIDESSPVARFLGTIDLFVVWWIIVLAAGMAAITGRRVRPVALALTGTYVALAVLFAIVMALSGGNA